MTYHSQYQQDRILNEAYFHNKQNGIFLDIGAYDGIIGSNTYFFEKELGWTGICIEPIPEMYQKLKVNRTCQTINAAAWICNETQEFQCITGYSSMLSGLVTTYPLAHQQRIDQEVKEYNQSVERITVDCIDINELLRTHSIKHVDLLSIDTEGSELQILSHFDFNQTKVEVILCENNYGDSSLHNTLMSKGYVFEGKIGADDVFKKVTFTF